MSDGQIFLQQLSQRLEQFFSEQADGFDVAPAELYRLEGMMAAAVSIELKTEAEFRQQLQELASRYGDATLLQMYCAEPRLILHMAMKAAPVYPSS